MLAEHCGHGSSSGEATPGSYRAYLPRRRRSSAGETPARSSSVVVLTRARFFLRVQDTDRLSTRSARFLFRVARLQGKGHGRSAKQFGFHRRIVDSILRDWFRIPSPDWWRAGGHAIRRRRFGRGRKAQGNDRSALQKNAGRSLTTYFFLRSLNALNTTLVRSRMPSRVKREPCNLREKTASHQR
jgi:hypothetical protein